MELLLEPTPFADRQIYEVREGEILAMHNVAAYGHSMLPATTVDFVHRRSW